MIRTGADFIFSSKEGYRRITLSRDPNHTRHIHIPNAHTCSLIFCRTVTDQDVDDLLVYGEKRTAELNEKLQEVGESELRNFSLDAPNINVYNFDGEDYREKQSHMASVIAANWIEPPKRERKATFSVDAYFRDALRQGDTQSSSKPKVRGQTYQKGRPVIKLSILCRRLVRPARPKCTTTSFTLSVFLSFWIRFEFALSN